jgi:GWxTD domain-containing protein
MKKLLFICLIIISGTTFAQIENYSQKPELKVKYYQDFLSFKANEGKSRLDVFIQVPYNAVQFVKTGQGFEASYSLTVSVFDESKQNLITEKIWNEKIVAISFELTTSPENFNLGHRSFELAPGVYFIQTSLTDNDSKNQYNSENVYEVKSFNSFPSMSDIMLVAKKTVVDGNTKIIPNVSRNILTDRDDLSTFFEIYSDTARSLLVDYLILDENEIEINKVTKQVDINKGTTQVFNNIDSLALNLGNYFLKVTMHDTSDKIYDHSIKSFVSRWYGVPNTITDLDKAIDEMIYIANPEDVSYINNAPDRMEKAKRFVAYWGKYDSNPSDAYNPVFNEYYSRVAMANANFSTYSLEGWRSDRGMVFIILGAPDNIERHPFEYYAKPYEIWQYYNLNRSFLFVDNTGFGDYRLDPSTPLYGDLYRFRY